MVSPAPFPVRKRASLASYPRQTFAMPLRELDRVETQDIRGTFARERGFEHQLVHYIMRQQHAPKLLTHQLRPLAAQDDILRPLQ